MSDSHAETLRAMFTEWERGDWRPGAELFSADIRFSAAQPEGQVRARGPHGVKNFMRGFLAEWELYRVELHDLEDRGKGKFLAVASQHAKGRGSGVETTAPAFIAIAFSDGEITQLEFFLERQAAAAALEAAALSE